MFWLNSNNQNAKQANFTACSLLLSFVDISLHFSCSTFFVLYFLLVFFVSAFNILFNYIKNIFEDFESYFGNCLTQCSAFLSRNGWRGYYCDVSFVCVSNEGLRNQMQVNAASLIKYKCVKGQRGLPLQSQWRIWKKEAQWLPNQREPFCSELYLTDLSYE